MEPFADNRRSRSVRLVGTVLISTFGIMLNLLLDGCISAYRPSLAKRADKISSSLSGVEQRHPGTVDTGHIVVALTPQRANTPTLEYLNSILKPYTAIATPGQSVAQVLRREFGTDRADLVAIVRRLNLDLFKKLEERSHDPANVGLTETTSLILPSLPLRTQTVKLQMLGESDLNTLTQRYYPLLTPSLERKIREENREILDPRDALWGEIVLPDVPMPRVAQLRKMGLTSVQKVLDVPEYATVVASVRSQLGASAEPSLKTEIETPVDFSLKADGGCGGSGPSDWFLDQIRARDVSESDLGLRTTRIAIIDSGIDTAHPAFRDLLYQLEPNESLDYDPYRRQKLGVDVTDLSKIYPIDTNPKSHGTHVSGLAAGIPVLRASKVRFALQLLIIKITKDASPETSYFHIGEALKVARNRGKARIFNLSFSAPVNQTIKDAFTVEMTPDLYVVAAGNGRETKKNEYERADLDSDEKSFPAFVGGRQLRGEVLIVAATVPSGRIAPFSNIGQQKVQIAAPGACILSTVRHDEGENGYAFRSGTSQAAPFVTFTAALLAAKQLEFSSESVKQRLLSTCDWEPLARGFVQNGCELNMAKALATGTDIVELKSGTSRAQANNKRSVVQGGPTDVDDSRCPRDPTSMDSGPHHGPLLRGEVQDGKFTLARDHKSDIALPVDVPLRRIWFGDNEVVQSVLFGSKVYCGNIRENTLKLKLEGRMACPYAKSAAGDCLIPLNDVRDIVFRKPVAATQ